MPNVGLVYGGKSTEHEISLISAHFIYTNLIQAGFDVTLILIDKAGAWYWQPEVTDTATLPAHYTEKQVISFSITPNGTRWTTPTSKLPDIDVIFPVLHGINGEDGTIQGFLRTLNIPFVGCDVLASSVCMDKEAMKHSLTTAGICVAKWQVVHAHEIGACDITSIIKKLGLPLFVKPINAGSSVGITKVETEDALLPALQYASQFDQKILIESMVEGREIECAVLGNQTPIVSSPGEILVNAAHDFYTYEAKYDDPNGAAIQIPADLTPAQKETIQQTASQAFKALFCEGLARVDCFLTPNNQVVINEVNTMPGFTQISMYPKLMAESGLPAPKLITELVNLALETFDRTNSLKLQLS